MRLIRGAAIAVVLGLAGVGAGSGSTGAAGASSRSPASPAVVTRTETFVDPSRPTGAPANLPDRTLVTTIRFPRPGGPYPLIVLAHGSDGHPRKFDELTRAWAASGYVVAAPAFPLTNDRAPGDSMVADFVEQPADVRFVIDEVMRLGRERGDPLRTRLDPELVGVAGLSFGGATILGVTFNSCCRDDRIDAAISMAGAPLPFAGVYDFSGVPLLLLHGDADPALPHAGSAEVYEAAAPPKFFVTILGGGHSPPFEDTDDPADEMVVAVTTDFWDLYLKGRRGALHNLRIDAAVDGLSTLRRDTD